MGYCIRLSGKDSRWVAVQPEDVSKPVDGVELVTQAPEFLGLSETGSPPPRAAIVAPGSTSGRVLIVVDEQGGVRFVACPEKGDQAELGGLVADLLASSGRLWHQPYESIAEPFEKELGVSLADRVAERAGKGWSPDAFKEGVGKSLQEGRFPVTVLTNEVDKPLQDMLGYLGNMNLQVAVLGYRYACGEGVEMVVPVRSAAPVLEPAAGPAPAQVSVPSEQEPSQAYIPGQVAHGEQHTVTVEFASQRPERPAAPSEPFPTDAVSPEQQKILAVLVRLDELGLVRRGFEYFLPGYERRESAEGTLVVSVDENRWPFPKPEEVVVVVNTGTDHLAGYLRLSTEEIEEFLGSLPRLQRKEHRGALLLRASTVHEAEQLVNELRALREVSGTGS